MQPTIAVPADAARSRATYTTLALIPAGIAFNLALAALIRALQLPIYMDAVGTIAITLLIGIRAGVVTGVASFLIGGLVISPVLPYFCATQAVIALYTGLLANRGAFRTIPRTTLAGLGLGIVAGIVSAPVIAYLFGGVTGNGASLVVAFLLASGKSVLKSVLLSGLAAEPIDKTLQCLLAVWLLRGMPAGLLARFPGGSLKRNGFIRT